MIYYCATCGKDFVRSEDAIYHITKNRRHYIEAREDEDDKDDE
jgi:DNA-directed RNA polymerase subunit RPC12/RpoP